MAGSSRSEATGLHIAVTGASGLIGSALTQRLAERGHRITRLVRRSAGNGEVSWDPEGGRLEPRDLEGIQAIVHLAGEPVGARWTRVRKAHIRNSRVGGTRLLADRLAQLERPPRVLVSASAVGIYGDRGDEVLTEASPLGDAGDGFLVSVAREWEAAAEPARAAGIRVVYPRFGVVLSPAGGALSRMLPPFRFGLGGRIGSGSQWISWISIDDAIGAILHFLATDIRGPVNVTAPEPLTNRNFTRILARVLARPALIPVPATALRFAFGEMANETLLSSVRVLPSRLLQSGYRFQYPELEGALSHVLGREPK